jgi:hypothetical protein
VRLADAVNVALVAVAELVADVVAPASVVVLDFRKVRQAAINRALDLKVRGRGRRVTHLFRIATPRRAELGRILGNDGRHNAEGGGKRKEYAECHFGAASGVCTSIRMKPPLGVRDSDLRLTEIQPQFP